MHVKRHIPAGRFRYSRIPLHIWKINALVNKENAKTERVQKKNTIHKRAELKTNFLFFDSGNASVSKAPFSSSSAIHFHGGRIDRSLFNMIYLRITLLAQAFLKFPLFLPGFSFHFFRFLPGDTSGCSYNFVEILISYGFYFNVFDSFYLNL